MVTDSDSLLEAYELEQMLHPEESSAEMATRILDAAIPFAEQAILDLAFATDDADVWKEVMGFLASCYIRNRRLYNRWQDLVWRSSRTSE